MKFWAFLTTISVTVAATWAADDVELASATFLGEAGERGLLRRAANRRCGRRLESCVAGAGTQEMPIQNWLASLDDFRGNDSVEQLISILNNAQTATSDRFVGRLTELRITERIPAFRIFRSTIADLSNLSFSGDNIDVAQSLNSIISIVQPLFTFLDNVIGAAQNRFLSLALQLTALTLQVTSTAQDVAASAITAAASLTRFLLNTLRDATAILLFPNADAACLIASMDCGFLAMMNEVMPVIIEITIVVGGSG